MLLMLGFNAANAACARRAPKKNRVLWAAYRGRWTVHDAYLQYRSERGNPVWCVSAAERFL